MPHSDPSDSFTAAIAALDLAPGSRVLDVGCGVGPHLEHFARAVGTGGLVLGLDRNEATLRRAADAHDAPPTAGRIVLCAGDHDAPPFAAATFDLVWMAMALHHAPDPAATLRTLRPLLQPGGQLAILEGDEAGSLPFLALARTWLLGSGGVDKSSARSVTRRIGMD